MPQRITPELVAMLRQFHPLWMNIHFNHAKEITPEVSEALARLADAGIPLGAQTVLLAGVNDSVEVMKELVHKLVRNRVRPYYIYQCDLVEGAGHFRTTVSKGIEIMEGLRGHTSGYAIPTYVVDAPGGGGKIPVGPKYVISQAPGKVVLRNFEGFITTYNEPPTYQQHDKAACLVLPERAPRARPVGRPRPARGRADVDRTEGLRGDPRPWQHRGAPPPGPVEVGAVSASARSRARPASALTGPRGRATDPRTATARRTRIRARRGAASAAKASPPPPPTESSSSAPWASCAACSAATGTLLTSRPMNPCPTNARA